MCGAAAGAPQAPGLHELSLAVTRYHFNASVLFFRCERPHVRQPAWSVSPRLGQAGSRCSTLTLTLTLTRGSETRYWRPCRSLGLRGSRRRGSQDWQTSGKPLDTAKHNTDDRGVICRLVNKLREINLRLLAGVTIDGSRDAQCIRTILFSSFFKVRKQFFSSLFQYLLAHSIFEKIFFINFFIPTLSKNCIWKKNCFTEMVKNGPFWHLEVKFEP